MSIQAMKQALEALETCTEGDHSTGHVIHPSFDEKAVTDAITALRAAITEAERQEPEQHFRYKFLDRAALDAWIATNTHPQPAIPDGWQLVPVEPTGEMLQAAFIYLEDIDFVATGIYKAMLAAAPKEMK